jgi:hypothetical protein
MFSTVITRASARRVVLQQRGYISRAHPRPIPEHPLPSALHKVMDGIEERKAKRVAKWERNAPTRQTKGLKVSSNFETLNEPVFSSGKTNSRS